MEHSVHCYFYLYCSEFLLMRKTLWSYQATKYTVWVVLLSLSSCCILPVSVVEMKLNKCSISIFSEYWNEWVRSLFYSLCVSSVNFLEIWVCCCCLNQFFKQTFIDQNLLQWMEGFFPSWWCGFCKEQLLWDLSNQLVLRSSVTMSDGAF